MLFRVDLDIPFVYSENDFDEMEKSNYEQFFIIDNKFIKIKNEKNVTEMESIYMKLFSRLRLLPYNN